MSDDRNVQDGAAASRQRSLSPTKRSAALMEGAGEESEMHTAPSIPSDTAMPDDTQSDKKEQDDDAEDLPPHTSMDTAPVAPTAGVAAATIDEQVQQIMELLKEPLTEGQKGFVVAHRWLGRVLARASSLPMTAPQGFDKDATEGEVGPVDNSDILPHGSQHTLSPFESSEDPYVPLLPGLTVGQEFEIVPQGAWDRIVSWYGVAEGQLPLVRYAHNTAPSGSAANIIFETYPPIYTIRKMIPGATRLSIPPTPPATSNPSQTSTGNTTPEKSSDQASVKIVASRTERFQTFLARSKKAAGIPLAHKVKIWRQLNTDHISNENAPSTEPGMLTPATSRSTSPSTAPAADRSSSSSQSLVMDASVFSKWEEDIDYEKVDAKDETANDKYNGKATLGTLELGQDQVFVLEEQVRGPAGGEYASDARRKATAKSQDGAASGGASTPSSTGPVTRGRTKRDGRPRGTVGLTNLGNTCYMNSALQCISRVEELALYFLHSNFKKDINPSNPLGYGGRMAKAYADLLTGLYAPGATSAFRPNQFKSALASAQPMFSGYGQQDSQEFLSFLVDALHEDLNRIQKKPYIENPDSDDSTVHDPEAIKALGQTYQDNHRLRNDSVAMDLFNGFYKNTMICPACDKVSVTFDPYSLLTLQLPIENTWRGRIYFVPHLGKPVTYEVDIDKNSTWKTVKQYIASKTDRLTYDRLMFAEIFSHKIYKVFSDNETISESGVQSNDVLCMYELPESPTNTNHSVKKNTYRSLYSSPEPPLPGMDSPLADRMAIPVMHSLGASRGSLPNVVLNPTFILVTRDEARNYDAILRKLLAAVAPMTTTDFLHEFSQDRPLPSTKTTEGDAVAPAEDNSSASADAEGQITDNSVPSEDGYVDVSVRDESGGPKAQSAEGVLEPSNFLPAAFRNLFEIKYVEGTSGDMFCTGTGSIGVGKLMQDRVQQHSQRRDSTASLQSTASERSQKSSTSALARSPPSSDEDAPDVILGGQGNDFSGDVQSDDDLAQSSVTVASKQSRRRDFHNKHKNRKNNKTYSKHARRNSKQSARSNTSRASTAQPTPESDEYYIRLGEGIVLDWHEETYDALFAGDRSGDDMRGTFTFDPKNMPVAEDLALRERLTKRKKRAQDGITLEDCFAETGKTEILSEENAWYCNRCKELRRASKTLEIWTVPDILVVHLKRFSGERYRRDKVDVLVDFPLEGLDLTKRVGCKEDGKDYVYDLFAVDNHYGGLGGGHYTAYAKNFFDGKWYDFNDSSVSQQNPNKVASTAAYLLFYRRRSDQPLGPPALQELINKVKNPDVDDASDAEYDSSGEGARLGDRSSASSRLLPGSSSAGTAAAGAANETLPPKGGASGLGNAANQVARLREMSEDDEGYSSGPVTNLTSGWGFGGLGDENLHSLSGGSGGAGSANTPAGDDDDDDDAASDRPEIGSDYAGSSGGDRLINDSNDFDDDVPGHGGDWSSGINQDDDDMFMDAPDDSLYMDADENQPEQQEYEMEAGGKVVTSSLSSTNEQHGNSMNGE
ncbi:hypothetical protein AAFC00_004018 [Neodothiora populina]|uniref:ubiquitinyl hydrolase 1 n=1 Tax=Neodothiora populina TaxID=2781224 RepID=A0ABR3PI89_9PEZI